MSKKCYYCRREDHLEERRVTTGRGKEEKYVCQFCDLLAYYEGELDMVASLSNITCFLSDKIDENHAEVMQQFRSLFRHSMEAQEK